MVCLLVSILTERCSDLRITLAVSLTSHSQVLAYLRALTHEVCAKTVVDNRIGHVLSYTYDVLASEVQFTFLCYFPLYDLFALRTTLRSLCALVYITTDRANKFLVHDSFRGFKKRLINCIIK
jgi:hypothetical protein